MNNFKFKFRVYYEDTDAQGVVYNSRYLNFMSRTRTEWLRSLGLFERYSDEGLESFFVVRHVEIDYLKPAKLSDMLEISCDVVKAGASSLVLRQEVCNAENSDQLFTSALVTLVNVDANFKPKRLDMDLRTLIS